MTVILAFSSDKTAEKVRNMLEGTSYRVSRAVCHSGASLLRTAGDYDEALIIMGFKLPDMTVNHVFENLQSGCKIISIMRSEHLENIEYDEIFSLPLPVSRQRLISAMNILLGYIPGEKRPAARSVAEDALVERAKLFLIETYHMTEQQAHRFIQKRSMDMGVRLVDTARTILNIDEQ